MEGDDEFGDLYTDVLLPAPQLPASSSFAAPAKPAPLPDPARPHPASVRTPAATAGGGFNWEEDDSAADGGDSDRGTSLARVSGIGGNSEATVIPGLALAPGLGGGGYGGGLDEDGGEDESDSEDDLQIVLNDNANPIAMDRRAMQGMGDEDDDEDGDDLVIVTGDDVNTSQPTEEQEGGDEAGAAPGEGERKDVADAAKANGGVAGAVGARIGYSNHAYNPHHSQFKVSLYGV